MCTATCIACPRPLLCPKPNPACLPPYSNAATNKAGNEAHTNITHQLASINRGATFFIDLYYNIYMYSTCQKEWNYLTLSTKCIANN